jgi:hypothetical protein
MKWGKHRTNSHDDEKMALLLDTFGPAGYGAYWLIWEIIGAQLEKSNTKVAYPESFWRKKLRISRGKLEVFLNFLKKNELFFVEVSGQIITVDCPNLLKYRDEYAIRKGGKSKKCRDNIGTNSRLRIDKRREEERRGEEEELKPRAGAGVDESLPTKNAPDSAPGQSETETGPDIGRGEAAALLVKIKPVFEAIWPGVQTVMVSDQMITHVQEMASKVPEFRNLEAWQNSAQRARASPFLRGEVPGKNGTRFTGMTLAWFLKPDTQANIANGQYDDRKAVEVKKDYGSSGDF